LAAFAVNRTPSKEKLASLVQISVMGYLGRIARLRKPLYRQRGWG
jgi:hypothetical protein